MGVGGKLQELVMLNRRGFITLSRSYSLDRKTSSFIWFLGFTSKCL